jgi:2-dehydro-3-deoxyphosphogluconate aldolase/(4S)-4-hydroxy-2-oxoglutarate aldolase
MRETVIQKVTDSKIIAIIRGLAEEKCLMLADALYAGGIEMIEVTFNNSRPEEFFKTANSIRAINDHFGGKVLAGAGTVTSPALVEMAADAGAKYIISPDTNIEVIEKTRSLGLVSMPGALTPTEIMTAHNAGADFVKVFPAANLGSAYIRAIRAPINHVKLLAVGGINGDNVKEFLQAGVMGFGIGGNLTNKQWIEAGEYHKITALAKELIAKVKE